MNPQIYVRALMKESIRQLMGLERRKRGLDMLADAIEAGMKRNDVNAGVESESKVEVKSNEEIDESGALNICWCRMVLHARYVSSEYTD